MMPQSLAMAKGCSQILWLFPDGSDDFFVTEAGAMNVFVYWKNSEGVEELTTYPLEDNLVLPGVTRNSLIAIAKDLGGFEGQRGWISFSLSMRDLCQCMLFFSVSERRLRMKSDLLTALAEGRVSLHFLFFFLFLLPFRSTRCSVLVPPVS